MSAAGAKQAYTKPGDPSFGERLIRSLAISGTFWPEVANVNAFNPRETPGRTLGETVTTRTSAARTFDPWKQKQNSDPSNGSLYVRNDK